MAGLRVFVVAISFLCGFTLLSCTSGNNTGTNTDVNTGTMSNINNNGAATTAISTPTPQAVSERWGAIGKYGWICKRGDAGEIGFEARDNAEIMAKLHRDSNPGHETIVDEVKKPDPSAVESDKLTVAKQQVDRITANLDKIAEKIDAVDATLHTDLNGYTTKRKQVALLLPPIIKDAEKTSQSVYAGLTVSEAAELQAYVATKIQSTAGKIASLNRDLYGDPGGGWLTTGPFSMRKASLATLSSEPIDHKEIDCGFYGPYHAEANCPSYSTHAECWCKVSFLGWGNATCECQPPPAIQRPQPPPPPPPSQSCSIPLRQYHCALDGSWVSGTDIGCSVTCITGYRPVCTENSCNPPYWNSSRCYCVPR